METKQYIVDAQDEGTRLDVYLTKELGQSRSYVQSLVKEGHVQVNGKTGKSNLKLSQGSEIYVTIPEVHEVEVEPLSLIKLVVWWSIQR